MRACYSLGCVCRMMPTTQRCFYVFLCPCPPSIVASTEMSSHDALECYRRQGKEAPSRRQLEGITECKGMRKVSLIHPIGPHTLPDRLGSDRIDSEQKT